MHSTPVADYWSLVRDVTLWAQGVATHAGMDVEVIVVDAPWFKAEKAIPSGIGDN